MFYVNEALLCLGSDGNIDEAELRTALALAGCHVKADEVKKMMKGAAGCYATPPHLSLTFVVSLEFPCAAGHGNIGNEQTTGIDILSLSLSLSLSLPPSLSLSLSLPLSLCMTPSLFLKFCCKML
jgi:hypothetical protein